MTEDMAVCPVRVERPLMRHRWETLTFLHWSFDPGVVQQLLPDGLEVDSCDGRAWVGLVPFAMRVGIRTGRGVPWLSRFWETNVRTYVRDEAGRPGIWFFSLDASRLGAVVAARASYRLPYFWSRMRLERSGDLVRYRCLRRWPAPSGARSDVSVEVGEPYAPDELQPLDHFLTARWRLFSVTRGARTTMALAEHEPWPLRRAKVTQCSDELVTAAGLPRPADPPLAHYSEGVTVRIGSPQSA